MLSTAWPEPGVFWGPGGKTLPGEETARPCCLLDHHRAPLLNVRAWFCSVRCPRSIPWGHPAAEMRPPFLQPDTMPLCFLFPPQAGRGTIPPRVGVMLCLALLRAPLLCLCSRCPSVVSPCRSSVPKAAAGGSSRGGGYSTKRFFCREGNGVPADTEPLWGVCVLLWGHLWGGQLGWGSRFSFGAGRRGAGVPGRVGEWWW